MPKGHPIEGGWVQKRTEQRHQRRTPKTPTSFPAGILRDEQGKPIYEDGLPVFDHCDEPLIPCDKSHSWRDGMDQTAFVNSPNQLANMPDLSVNRLTIEAGSFSYESAKHITRVLKPNGTVVVTLPATKKEKQK